MKFRIWTILWVFALFASGMAMYGAGSIFVSLLVTGFWAVFTVKWGLGLREGAVAFLMIFGLTVLLIPAAVASRASAIQAHCRNNMRVLAIALLNFESAYNRFPSARNAGSDSEYQHSWRAIILPFVESSPLNGQYRMNEPWSSPFNTKLISHRFGDYCRCPLNRELEEKLTEYLAVVGDRAVLCTDRGRTVSDITDGTSKTIMLIEVPHKKVNWAEPRDLTMLEAIEFLSNPPNSNDYGHPMSEGCFYKPSRGVHVAFADGWTRLLKLPISRKHAEGLLTINGEELIDPDNIPSTHQPELNYARIYSFSVFVILSFLPATKLRKKQSTNAEPAD